VSTELTIRELHAREILDSRGAPTLEVEVTLAGGVTGRAAVPSGASTGSREAVELRDGERRYRGKGVRRAVASVTGTMARGLRGVRADDQAHVDRLLCEMDGTPAKTRLGANAILGVSLAVAKAAAAAQHVPLHRAFGAAGPPHLPVPMLNVLNGGRHAAGGLDFQELMIVPIAWGSTARPGAQPGKRSSTRAAMSLAP
jgi:enolase